jgi:hypothetical protein
MFEILLEVWKIFLFSSAIVLTVFSLIVPIIIGMLIFSVILKWLEKHGLS